MKNETDMTDLIPKGLGVYWLIFFAGLGLIAVLEVSFLRLPILAASLGVERFPLLDLASSNCLLSWLASIVLFLISGVSLINYRLGGKRKDRPVREGIWFWAALAALYLSMEVQVGFRESIREILVSATGTSLYKEGGAWWFAAYIFFLGTIATRLIRDMSGCPFALGLFLLSLAASTATALNQAGLIVFNVGSTDLIMLRTGLYSVSALFLFLSFLLFGRWQILLDPDALHKWLDKTKNRFLCANKQRGATAGAPKQPTGTPPHIMPGFSKETSRPLIQKDAGTIPFHSQGKADDYDLTRLA